MYTILKIIIIIMLALLCPTWFILAMLLIALLVQIDNK